MALVYSTIKSRNYDYCGYINEKGNEIIPLQYEFGENFSQGLALVRQNGLFGFIDKRGEVIIPFKFSDADSFDSGKARVELKNHQFYIDKIGNEI